ncbi:hypothetical protein KCU83_g7649, partial [Aureobasidium melanogenum]
MVKVHKNKFLTEGECKKAYAAYATNIELRWVEVKFGNIGDSCEMIGANKSYKSGINGVFFRTVTMACTNGKFKVSVYRGEGVKYVQDSSEIDIGTKEEVLKVMRERATGEKQEVPIE